MRTVTPTTVDVGNIQDALGINPFIRMLSYNAENILVLTLWVLTHLLGCYSKTPIRICNSALTLNQIYRKAI